MGWAESDHHDSVSTPLKRCQHRRTYVEFVGHLLYDRQGPQHITSAKVRYRHNCVTRRLTGMQCDSEAPADRRALCRMCQARHIERNA